MRNNFKYLNIPLLLMSVFLFTACFSRESKESGLLETRDITPEINIYFVKNTRQLSITVDLKKIDEQRDSPIFHELLQLSDNEFLNAQINDGETLSITEIKREVSADEPDFLERLYYQRVTDDIASPNDEVTVTLSRLHPGTEEHSVSQVTLPTPITLLSPTVLNQADTYHLEWQAGSDEEQLLVTAHMRCKSESLFLNPGVNFNTREELVIENTGSIVLKHDDFGSSCNTRQPHLQRFVLSTYREGTLSDNYHLGGKIRALSAAEIEIR